MPLLHHLARTGGTLISRCLASMEDVCLLSEIHPAGADHFNPLRQAADWYGLVSDDQAQSFDPDNSESVRNAVDLIQKQAHQKRPNADRPRLVLLGLDRVPFRDIATDAFHLG